MRHKKYINSHKHSQTHSHGHENSHTRVHRQHIIFSTRVAGQSTSLEARLPLLFWLSLPDAFCRCLALKHFADAGIQTCTCTPTHIHWDTHTDVHSVVHRHITTCTQTHSYIQAHSCTLPYQLHPMTPQTRTHIYTHTSPHTVNPHHPWVMNNICLSVPPSLPLAWLLASSWLHCHNVILSASLSPITKMCSDNQAFLHRRLPSHQTGTSSSSLHRDLIKWCGVILQACWEHSHGSGQDFTWWVLLFSLWKYNWLPGIGRFGSH